MTSLCHFVSKVRLISCLFFFCCGVKQAQRHQANLPLLIGARPTEKNVRQFTDEQLKAGNSIIGLQVPTPQRPTAPPPRLPRACAHLHVVGSPVDQAKTHLNLWDESMIYFRFRLHSVVSVVIVKASHIVYDCMKHFSLLWWYCNNNAILGKQLESASLHLKQHVKACMLYRWKDQGYSHYNLTFKSVHRWRSMTSRAMLSSGAASPGQPSVLHRSQTNWEECSRIHWWTVASWKVYNRTSGWEVAVCSSLRRCSTICSITIQLLWKQFLK